MSQIYKASTGGGGSGITTIDGDTGFVTGSTVTIYANQAGNNCGQTVLFSGDDATTMTMNVSDGSGNTAIGNDATFSFSCTNNTILGQDITVGFSVNNDVIIGQDMIIGSEGGGNVVIGQATSIGHANSSVIIGQGSAGGGYHGSNCIVIGAGSFILPSSNANEIAIGAETLVNDSFGNGNIAIGTFTLNTLNPDGAGGGNNNTSCGTNSLFNLSNGNDNTALGVNAGNSYTSTETKNLVLGSHCLGTVGESRAIHIADATSTAGYSATTCFIGGIYGVTVSSPSMVTIDSAGQLGSAAISSGGIQTIDGNTGSVTGSTVTIETVTATDSGTTLFTGNAGHTILSLNYLNNVSNLLIGPPGATFTNATANTGFGYKALEDLVDADSPGSNTAYGAFAGSRITSGSGNVCLGPTAGGNITTGSENVMITNGTSITGSLTGTGNICIGVGTAENYVNAESFNILIGNSDGVANETNQLRLGYTTGNASLITGTFIDGIAGTTIANHVAVLVNSATGQLGDISSSLRFKQDVKTIDSSKIHSLNPVAFKYKKTPTEQQYGLIAEEVFKVMPELIAYDAKGEIYSVQYHKMYALLLSEIQKLRKDVDQIKGTK
jgi:trimeric autotransporter adhesin